MTKTQQQQCTWSNSTNNDNNVGLLNADDDKIPMVPEGGPAMIFAMARRMLVWDDDKFQGLNDSSKTATTTQQQQRRQVDPDVYEFADPNAFAYPQTPRRPPASSAPLTTKVTVTTAPQPALLADPRPLPRWRPHGGIADYNPAFRDKAPVMNSLGYANAIRRNSRKKNKPAMWRYAVRTYDRMATNNHNSARKIPIKDVHHEGVLVACSKLGYWEKAVSVYDEVRFDSSEGGGTVTDGMIASLLGACVRGARRDRTRRPLDVAAVVLATLHSRHDVPVVARHVNAVAAAYQSLGLHDEATSLVRTHLTRRAVDADPDDPDRLNVADLSARDRGSYNLLVKGAVVDRDWERAVAALEEMTESGVRPNRRCLNTWSESGESGGYRSKRR